MKMSVGVDLHKGQFTVYWMSEDRSLERFERYGTNIIGFDKFETELRHYLQVGHLVEVAARVDWQHEVLQEPHRAGWSEGDDQHAKVQGGQRVGEEDRPA